MIHIVG